MASGSPEAISFFEALRLSAQRKISPASTVYPDAALIVAPAVALLAGRPASLPHQSHPATGISLTILAVTVVGRAGNDVVDRTRRPDWRARSAGSGRITRTRSRAVSRDSDKEVSSASAIHPYASAIVAPAIALLAGRAASLIHQAYAISCISCAVVSVAIVGSTGKPAATPVRGAALRRRMQCAECHQTCSQKNEFQDFQNLPPQSIRRIRRVLYTNKYVSGCEYPNHYVIEQNPFEMRYRQIAGTDPLSSYLSPTSLIDHPHA